VKAAAHRHHTEEARVESRAWVRRTGNGPARNAAPALSGLADTTPPRDALSGAAPRSAPAALAARPAHKAPRHGRPHGPRRRREAAAAGLSRVRRGHLAAGPGILIREETDV